MKRSQAINIGLTKLPPIRALKQAILAMDSAVIDREGIDVSIITVTQRYLLIYLAWEAIEKYTILL